MDISEKALFKELALVKKSEEKRREKDYLRNKKKESLQPVTKQQAPVSANKREILEREIVKLLLLHGIKEIEVEDWEIKEIPEDNSEPVIEKIKRNTIVAEEIFKQLQEDELEFSHPVFSRLYQSLITPNLQKEAVNIAQLMSSLSDEEARFVSDILMEEEKYTLANWEERQIEVKPKEANLGWHVMDILFNLRRLLIQDLIKKQNENLKNVENEHQRIDIFNEIKDYLFLFRLVSNKLYRLI